MIRLLIKAIPTGSFAPDSPSRMVPLRPLIWRRPSTENTTAGSVGETAVAASSAMYQLKPNPTCRTAAPAPAVRNVPITPTTAIGQTAERKRSQPMCMPPLNRTHTNATVTTRSTVRWPGGVQPGDSRHGHGAGDQHQSWQRDLEPLGEATGDDDGQADRCSQQDDDGERLSVSHDGLQWSGAAALNADQASRLTATQSSGRSPRIRAVASRTT